MPLNFSVGWIKDWMVICGAVRSHVCGPGQGQKRLSPPSRPHISLMPPRPCLRAPIKTCPIPFSPLRMYADFEFPNYAKWKRCCVGRDAKWLIARNRK